MIRQRRTRRRQNQKWVGELVRKSDGGFTGLFAIGTAGRTAQFALATRYDSRADCQADCDEKNASMGSESGKRWEPVKYGLVSNVQ